MTELYAMFKKCHPETIGEKDIEFAPSNYIDWLEASYLEQKELADDLHRKYHFYCHLSEDESERADKLEEALRTAIEMIEYQECRCCGKPLTSDPRCGLSDHEFVFDHIDEIKAVLS